MSSYYTDGGKSTIECLWQTCRKMIKEFVCSLSFCTACSQTTSISTSIVRQSDAADADDKQDVTKTLDTAALPDVNTGLPTVCSTTSIASSTETTDNECEYMYCHFVPNYSDFCIIAHTIFCCLFWFASCSVNEIYR